MNKANKDLTKLINQISILHLENPGLQVSDREKNRLKTAVHHLLIRLKISSKTWEEIKPYNPELLGVVEQRKNSN